MSFKYSIVLLTLMAVFALAENSQAGTKSNNVAKADMAILEETNSNTDNKNDDNNKMNKSEEEKSSEVDPSPKQSPTTVGDFIIQPLIAFRPRPATPAVEEGPAGKQADQTTTTPTPWPIFGLGYGQAIGSSVSSLAGTLSNWLNDRLQLPGLVDTPVGSTTTTTTTPRPDVIVRVQHRPSISLANNRRRRPNAGNSIDNQDDDYEQDEADFEEDEEDSENEYDGEDVDNIDDEDEEEEIEYIRPVNQRRPQRKQQIRPQVNRPNRNRRPIQRRRPQYYDDYAQDDSDDEQYYETQSNIKRSQNQNILKLGQSNLLNQIRLLTRGEVDDEEATPLFVRRNGQIVYLAPELLSESDLQQGLTNSKPISNFPQPPLTKPLKVNGQIQQYITIPYNQLGILHPQAAISVAEGIQDQPLILNIPQATFQKLQNKDKSDGPLITPNAVPLLTETSLSDIFKQPQFPPSRTNPNTQSATTTYTPLVYLAHTGNKVHPGTVVEKAPNVAIKEVKTEQAYIILNDDAEEEPRQAPKSNNFKAPKGNRFAIRKGREQQIPVEIVHDSEIPVKTKTETNSSPEQPLVLSAIPETAPAIEKEENVESSTESPLKFVE